MAHLAQPQGIYFITDAFFCQLKEAEIDQDQLRQAQGFMEVIPGQTTYDRGKALLSRLAILGEGKVY